MRNLLTPKNCGAAAVALLFLASTMFAADIRDEAGFFSESAKTAANERIRALERKHGAEIRIETYAQLPAGQAATARSWTSHEKEQFYQNWIISRSQATNAKGLFVLATREPAHLKVAEGKSLVQRGFTQADKLAVRDALIAKFKTKEYDRGLTDAVSQLETSFAKLSAAGMPAVRGTGARSGTTLYPQTSHAGTRNVPAAGGGSFGWTGLIIMIVVGVLGFMLLSSIMRGLFGGGGGGYGGQGGYGAQQGGYGGGGGGGFMSSLFGSVAGSMAGNWMYDSMFRNHSSGHSGGTYSGNDPYQQSGGYDNTSGGSDFSGGDLSGGGDFGGDSGGGDFGGGDSGGGDF